MSQPTPGPQLIAPGYIQRLEEVNTDLLAALKDILADLEQYDRAIGGLWVSILDRMVEARIAIRLARAEGAS